MHRRLLAAVAGGRALATHDPPPRVTTSPWLTGDVEHDSSGMPHWSGLAIARGRYCRALIVVTRAALGCLPDVRHCQRRMRSCAEAVGNWWSFGPRP